MEMGKSKKIKPDSLIDRVNELEKELTECKQRNLLLNSRILEDEELIQSLICYIESLPKKYRLTKDVKGLGSMADVVQNKMKEYGHADLSIIPTFTQDEKEYSEASFYYKQGGFKTLYQALKYYYDKHEDKEKESFLDYKKRGESFLKYHRYYPFDKIKKIKPYQIARKN